MTARQKVSKRSKSISSKQKGVVRSFAQSTFRLGESYTSLILGLIVVIVVGAFLFTFFGNRKPFVTTPTKATSSTATKAEDGTQATLAQKTSGGTYTVAPGDDLWSIAQKQYGSGYYWIDISSANKLTNPNMIAVGTKLTLPNVEKKVLTQAQPQNATPQNTISGIAYNVVSGDNLWDISLRAYGDGFKWVDIVKANNLANPNLIHSGNKLKIPR